MIASCLESCCPNDRCEQEGNQKENGQSEADAHFGSCYLSGRSCYRGYFNI